MKASTLWPGIKQITQGLDGSQQVPEYGRSNLLAMLAIIPPVAVVIFFQRWFVKGLTESLTQNSMSNDNALRCAW